MVAVRAFRGLFLVCADLRRSVEFYRSLGFSLEKSTTRSSILRLGDSLSLHLHESLSQAEQQAFGVSWQKGSTGMVLLFTCPDLEELWRSAPDVAREVAPVNTPWGDRIAILLDPDGYRLEFRQGAS